MIQLLTKTFNEISADDLTELINDEVPEGDQIEYKETLPSKNQHDSWINQQERIGDHAKNTILEEAVAFANSQGGVLVIGMEESHTEHNYAKAIRPLPKCTEPANRFTLIFRDGVDPSLSTVEIKGDYLLNYT